MSCFAVLFPLCQPVNQGPLAETEQQDPVKFTERAGHQQPFGGEQIPRFLLLLEHLLSITAT